MTKSHTIEVPRQLAVDDTQRLDPYFAVFNCHINNAKERADSEFTALFGTQKWNRHIKPRHDEGLMTIFNHENKWTLLWVTLVCAFVNAEGRRIYVSDGEVTTD